MPLDKNDAPTISELIADLETVRDEHGDLPVVCIEQVWHYFPDPTVEEGSDHDLYEDNRIKTKRVEL